MRSRQPHLARAALIAAVPASAVLAAATATQRAGPLAYALIVVALAGIAAAAGPRALAAGHLVSAAIALAAGATLWVGGVVWLTVAIVSLCADSATAGLIALACGGTVYLAGSIYAVRSWRTAMWAWPLAVVLSVAVAIGVLAVATGGPHACTT